MGTLVVVEKVWGCVVRLRNVCLSFSLSLHSAEAAMWSVFAEHHRKHNIMIEVTFTYYRVKIR